MTVFIVTYDRADWGNPVWEFKKCFATRNEAEKYVEEKSAYDSYDGYDGKDMWKIIEKTL